MRRMSTNQADAPKGHSNLSGSAGDVNRNRLRVGSIYWEPPRTGMAHVVGGVIHSRFPFGFVVEDGGERREEDGSD